MREFKVVTDRQSELAREEIKEGKNVKFVAVEHQDERNVVLGIAMAGHKDLLNGIRNRETGDYADKSVRLIGGGWITNWDSVLRVRWRSEGCLQQEGYDRPSTREEAEKVAQEIIEAVRSWLDQTL